MKNYTMWLLCTLLVGCSQKDAAKPLYFAHVLPARETEEARQGMQLAVEQVNASTDKVLEHKMAVLRVEGEKSDEAIENEVVRLCRVNNVGGVFVQASVAKLAPSGGVPLLCAWDKPDREVGDAVFHLGLSPANRGRLLAKLARDAETGLKLDRVGIVANREGQAIKDAFTADVPATELAGSWTYAKPEELENISKDLQGSKAVLFVGSVDDLKAWLKSAQVPVLFAGDRLMPADIADAKVPVYRLATFWAEDDVESTKDFVRDYKEKFKETPREVAAQAFEAMQLFRSAFQTAKVLELSKMRKALRSETWSCLSGKLSFDDKGWPSRAAYAIKVEQGNATLAMKFPKPETKSE